jgi:hypothetical protein
LTASNLNMKKSILLTIIICLAMCVMSTSAQKGRKPVRKAAPKRVVETLMEEPEVPAGVPSSFTPGKPDGDGWSLYESADDSFKLAFPPTPVMTDTLDEFGKKDGSRYYNPEPVTPAKLSLTLMVTPLQTTGVDAEFKRRLYNGWVEGVVGDDGSGRAAVKVSQKEFSFGDSFGLEIVVDREDFRFQGRIICPLDKCYQLAIGSASPKAVKPEEYAEINKWTQKFFNSFELLKTKSVVDPIFGKVENGVYTNDVLRFSISVPADWYSLSVEKTQADTERLRTLVQGDNAFYNKLLDENFKVERFVLQYARKPAGSPGNASLGISVQKLSPGFPLLEKSAGTTRKALMAGNLAPQIAPVKIKYFGKIRSALLEAVTNYNGVEVKQRLYLIQTRGYGVNVVLSYIDDMDLLVMENSIKTLQFK